MLPLASSALVAAALLGTLASTAAAQPSAAAPQTHDWNEVSHINGQLVPVGETNAYVKRYRRFNVASNPIGWMVGIYGVSASYGINDHVAIRGDVTYYDLVGEDDTGVELGLGVPIYLRRTYQGAFLEPGLITRHFGDAHDDGDDDSDTTVGPQVLFGWHWTWDSGLNVALAAGVGRDLDRDEDCDAYDCYETDEEIFFNGYFRVGYAF